MMQLKYFTVIAKYNSLTKAAEELHISQPAMSVVLKKLEGELGTALFDRTANRIQLNRAGKTALAYAECILQSAEQMKADLQTYAAGTAISAAFCDPGVQWYCEPVFAAQCPDVQLKAFLYERENDEVKLLMSRVYDIVVSPYKICDSAVISQPFLKDQVYLSVPKDSVYASMPSVSLRQLQGPLLMSGMGGYFLRNLERIIERENPKVTLIKNDWIVTQQLIRTTNILATSSTMAVLMEVRNDGPHRTLIPLCDKEQQAWYHINGLKETAGKTKPFFDWAERCRKQMEGKVDALVTGS